MAITQGRRELTDAQDAHAYRSNEIRLTPEDLTRTFVRATDTDLNSEFSTCNALGFLTPRRVEISGASAHASRVITDPMDVTASRQQQSCKPCGVEPLVRRVFDTAVVEVEPIDVDVGASHKKQRLPFGSLAPYPRRDRGDWNFRSAGSLRPRNCGVKERPRRSGGSGPTT